MDPVKLSNGLKIELVNDGDNFLGIGRVWINGIALRSGRLPMFVEIRNPSGVLITNYSLVDVRDVAGGVDLEFSVKQIAGGMMEFAVHEVRNRYNTTDWTKEPQPAPGTHLIMELRPVERIVGEVLCRGFSYRYRYCSDSIPIYKILDRGSWEVNGEAVGSEFWMRNCFVPSVVSMDSLDQFYSSEWYLPAAANPNILQFLPLQTELQGFTFTRSESGVLMTWATRVAHIRSLFEKPREQNEWIHWHEHCGDLSHEFVTSPMEVLWAPGALDRVGRTNLYHEFREQVHEILHQQADLRRERVTTYGQIEEWGRVDMDRYREIGLPKLLAAGCQTIYLANHFENNMNVWSVSNMCCTVDYKVAESVGKEKLQRFCQEAHKAGATVEMWANTSISTLTLKFADHNGSPDRIKFLPEEDSIMEALKKSRDPFVRNISYAIEADHYTPSFAVLNLRDPVVQEYWMRRWTEAHDEVGLDGIFLDSSFNLSSDKFHYVQNPNAGLTGATADQTHLLGHFRPAKEPDAAILSQYMAHLQLMGEMQHAGYVYCNEDLGVFGIHRHGPDVCARLNCLSIWSDCICNFDVRSLTNAGVDTDEVFFKGLAYRMMWSLFWDIQSDRLSFFCDRVRDDQDMPSEWHCSILRAFNKMNDIMRQRTILPDETGVLYTDGQSQVLWAFQDLSLPFEKEMAVVDVLDDSGALCSLLHAKGRHIYHIGSKVRSAKD